MTDEQLVAQLGKHPEVFDELYHRYAERIYKFISFRVANPQDAEDLVSQVFLRVLEAHHSFRARYAFSTWIFTIAKHLVIDHYRKQKPTVTLDERNEPPSLENLEQSLGTELELEAALAKLSDTERTMLTLHVLDGLTYKEIASTFGVSTDAIKKRFERMKKRFA